MSDFCSFGFKSLHYVVSNSNNNTLKLTLKGSNVSLKWLLKSNESNHLQRSFWFFKCKWQSSSAKKVSPLFRGGMGDHLQEWICQKNISDCMAKFQDVLWISCRSNMMAKAMSEAVASVVEGSKSVCLCTWAHFSGMGLIMLDIILKKVRVEGDISKKLQ